MTEYDNLPFGEACAPPSASSGACVGGQGAAQAQGAAIMSQKKAALEVRINNGIRLVEDAIDKLADLLSILERMAKDPFVKQEIHRRICRIQEEKFNCDSQARIALEKLFCHEFDDPSEIDEVEVRIHGVVLLETLAKRQAEFEKLFPKETKGPQL